MQESLQGLLDQFHARVPIRAGSLIVSLFGDAIVPRGGQLALSSLVAIMRAFRINEGLVRTAMSRLVRDGLFERSKLGRNSFYRLSRSGQRTFAEATSRIYGSPVRHWNGAFALLLLDNGQDRGALRAELRAAGCGELAPGWVLHPAAETPVPDGNGFIRLTATAADPTIARRLAARAWPIGEIEARYRDFLAAFTPIFSAEVSGVPLAPVEALVARILLIHDYRRVILRDPLLPVELLPEPWAGGAARQLCGRLYRQLVPAAERWLDTEAMADRGPLPPPDPTFAGRFAVLD